MALIRVRANGGDHHETEVDEVWLTRWPDDYTPIADGVAPAEAAPAPQTVARATEPTPDDSNRYGYAAGR